MSQQYYMILTTVGKFKVSDALVNQTTIKLTEFSIGDGNGVVYSPTSSQSGLARELYRAPLLYAKADPENNDWMSLRGVIPEETSLAQHDRSESP